LFSTKLSGKIVALPITETFSASRTMPCVTFVALVVVLLVYWVTTLPAIVFFKCWTLANRPIDYGHVCSVTAGIAAELEPLVAKDLSATHSATVFKHQAASRSHPLGILQIAFGFLKSLLGHRLTLAPY